MKNLATQHCVPCEGGVEPLKEEELKNLIAGIKQFPEVMMTAEIPLKKIKSRERLEYEEEKPVHKLILPKRFK